MDESRAAGHLLHHGAGVERVRVVPQDAPDLPRVLVLVGADSRLTHHVPAGEYETWAADHRRLQHRARLLVGGVKLRRLVTPAGLQRFAQDVLLGYAREGNRVLENVDPKARVKLLHLLQRLQEGGNVQVVVVLQPVTEGLHAPLAENAVAVVVLLQREHVIALELGVPGHVRGQAGEVQLVRAVEPLVQESGFGKGGAVSFDPLLVRDARAQVVQHVQELELGGVDEHDPAVLLRRKCSGISRQERDEVPADELEIVVTRVEAQHRHLGDPFRDLLALLFRDTLDVWEGDLVHHVRYDCHLAALQGLVEEADQLCRVPGYDVLRLRVQGVRQGNRDGDVLALVEEVAGRACRLARVLVRLEVVDDRVGVSFRLPFWAARVCPGSGLFVLPLFDHPVALLAQKLGPLQGELVGGFPAYRLLLGVQPWDHFALPGLLLHKPLALFGVALLAVMPKAAVELENRFRLRVIPIHSSAKNLPLACDRMPNF